MSEFHFTGALCEVGPTQIAELIMVVIAGLPVLHRMRLNIKKTQCRLRISHQMSRKGFVMISHQISRKHRVFYICSIKYHENTTLFKLFPTTPVDVGLLNLQP